MILNIITLFRSVARDDISGHIYLAVVKSVLLYGSETWVMTLCTRRVLGGFHHSVDHRMTGRQPQRGKDGVWIYPILEDAMAEVGLQEVGAYVYH